MQNSKARNNLIKSIISDKAIRRAVTKRSHYWFFYIFLGHYAEYEIALFQREMFKLTEDKRSKLVVIMAFRGSGKSTIMNLSYALWSILGVQQKKFVLIVSKTQSQAKNQFLNIREELKSNNLLTQDLGPFDADETSWGMSTLVLSKVGARITATSREQSLRGIRSGQHRPDLIIVDDLEDSTSVKSKADRDATYEWFMSEVMPAGNKNTKIIVLGNLLGADSLLMRLRENIKQEKLKGIFRAYPLLDDNDQALWPGKFGSMKEIDELKNNISDRLVWKREYLLKYIPEKMLTELSKAADRLRRKEELGEESEPEDPLQILGKYRISSPTMTFSPFGWRDGS